MNSSSSARPRPVAKNKVLSNLLSYREVYRASPSERIAMIKEGVSATDVKRLFTQLGISQCTGFKALNLSPVTFNKKAKKGQTLLLNESERVIGIAKLIGQLEAMIEESGNSEGFDATAWMSRWLSEPVPALGGVRPIELLDTMEGQALLSVLLSQMQSGAYA